MRPSWRSGPVVLAVVCAAAMAGCGNGQLKAASGLDPADQLLTPTMIANAPAGPMRAFDQWWYYIQYNDAGGYLRSLAPGLRRREANDPLLSDELPVTSRALDVARPDPVSVEISGDQATISTLLTYHQLVGASTFTSVQVPQAFSMVRIRGRWYVADDTFVYEQARPVLVSSGVLPAAVAAGATSQSGAAAANAAGLPRLPGHAAGTTGVTGVTGVTGTTGR
jgi:hypothetical protein